MQPEIPGTYAKKWWAIWQCQKCGVTSYNETELWRVDPPEPQERTYKMGDTFLSCKHRYGDMKMIIGGVIPGKEPKK